jgi:hypothetical protein
MEEKCPTVSGMTTEETLTLRIAEYLDEPFADLNDVAFADLVDEVRDELLDRFAKVSARG